MGYHAKPDQMTAYRQRRYERLADKNLLAAALLGVLLPPVAYIYVGKWWWALLNLVTVNYLLLGILLVPWHVGKTIRTARAEVSEIYDDDIGSDTDPAETTENGADDDAGIGRPDTTGDDGNAHDDAYGDAHDESERRAGNDDGD